MVITTRVRSATLVSADASDASATMISRSFSTGSIPASRVRTALELVLAAADQRPAQAGRRVLGEVLGGEPAGEAGGPEEHQVEVAASPRKQACRHSRTAVDTGGTGPGREASHPYAVAAPSPPFHHRRRGHRRPRRRLRRRHRRHRRPSERRSTPDRDPCRGTASTPRRSPSPAATSLRRSPATTSSTGTSRAASTASAPTAGTTLRRPALRPADGRQPSTTASTASGELAKSPSPLAATARVTNGDSGTNVQEPGVDEPDVVKTDGRTLFRVEGDDLVTYDVTGDEVERLASEDLTDLRDGEILLSGDTVVAIGTTPAPAGRSTRTARPPRPGSSSSTSPTRATRRSSTPTRTARPRSRPDCTATPSGW